MSNKSTITRLILVAIIALAILISGITICTISTGFKSKDAFALPSVFTVTYDKNNPDCTEAVPIDNTSYNPNANVDVLPDTLSCEGYLFLGWSMEAVDGEPISSFTITKDTTLYGVWAGPHEHGNVGDEDYIKFDKILTSEFVGGEMTSGSYYLYEDITLTQSIFIPEDVEVKICLHGHVLNLNGSNSIKLYGTLSIYDDEEDSEEHKFTIDEATQKATLDQSGTTSVYGGIITGLDTDSVFGIIHRYESINENSSVKIYTSGNRELYIQGAVIIGNNLNCSSIIGDVFGLISAASVTMDDVTIQNNSVSFTHDGLASTKLYGGLITAQTLDVKNLQIIDNTVNNSSYNSTIFGGLLYGYNFSASNNFVSGNTITNTITHAYGLPSLRGGVYGAYYQIYIENDTCIDNTFTNNGGIEGAYVCVFTENSTKTTTIVNSTFGMKKDETAHGNTINSTNSALTGVIVSVTTNLTMDISAEYNTISASSFLYGAFLSCFEYDADLQFNYNTINVNYVSYGIFTNSFLYKSTTEDTYGGTITGGIKHNTITTTATNNGIYTHGIFVSQLVIEVDCNKKSMTLSNLDISYNNITTYNSTFGWIAYNNNEAIKMESCTVSNNVINTTSIINGGISSQKLSMNKCDLFKNEFHDKSDISTLEFLGLFIYLTANYANEPGNAPTLTEVNIYDNEIEYHSSKTCIGMLVYILPFDEANNNLPIELNNCKFDTNKFTADKCDCIYGLFFARTTINFADGQINGNECTITVDKYNPAYYGVLMCCGGPEDALNITGTEVKDNTIEVSSNLGKLVGGLFHSYAKMVIDDVDFINNTVTCKKTTIFGGLVASKTYEVDSTTNNTITIKNNSTIVGNKINYNHTLNGGLIYGGYGIFINQTAIYGNTITATEKQDAGTKARISGGIINSQDRLDVKNTDIYSNTLTGKDLTSLAGGIFFITMQINNTNIIQNVNIYNNTFNTEFVDTNTTYAYGLVLDCAAYSSYSDILTTIKSTKVYNNSFTGSARYLQGLFDIYNALLENTEIYDNTLVDNREDFAEYSFVGGYYQNYGITDFVGKIVIDNNTLNGTQSNYVIVFIGDTEKANGNVGDLSKLDTQNSVISLGYAGMSDTTCILVVTGTEDILSTGVFKSDSERYYLSSNNNNIFLNGRVKAQPSKDNNYTYDISKERYSGEYSYQWYRIGKDSSTLLTGNTSKTLDRTKITIGTYQCIITAKTGTKVDFTITSLKVKIIPDFINQPSADNQYTLDADISNINESGVNVSYSWCKSGENPYQVTYITNENCTVESSCPMWTGDFSSDYNADTKTWHADDNQALVLTIDCEAGDTLVFSQKYDGLGYIYAYIYTSTKDLMEIYYSCAYTFAEDTTCTILIVNISISDSSYIAFDVSIGILTEYDEMEDSRITTYSADAGTALISIFSYTACETTKTDTGYAFNGYGVISIEINENETVFVKTQDDSTLFAIVYVFYDEVTYNSLIYNVDGEVFNGFAYTALKTGTYYFVTYCADSTTYTPKIGEAVVYYCGGESYVAVEGQTDKDLRGNDKDYYIGKVTYSDGFDTITIKSSKFYFDPYYVTYDITSASGTAPVDTTKYKQNSDVTLIDQGKNATYTGYKLKGWSQNSDGSGTIYKVGDKVKITKDLKFYAVWELDIPEKITNTITLDTTAIEVTYGEKVTLPTATSIVSANIICNYKASDLVNAGTYTVTYTINETDTYKGDTKSLTITIKPAKVNEPTINGTYIYNGNKQTVQVFGVEPYMSTNDSLTQTEAGVYTITYILDNNHAWATGSDGIVTWEIKSTTEPEKEADTDTIVEPENSADASYYKHWILLGGSLVMLLLIVIILALYIKASKARKAMYVIAIVLGVAITVASFFIMTCTSLCYGIFAINIVLALTTIAITIALPKIDD